MFLKGKNTKQYALYAEKALLLKQAGIDLDKWEAEKNENR